MSSSINSLNDLLNHPELKKAEKELADYVSEQYKVFDAQVFVGTDLSGKIKCFYSYAKHGMFKIEIDPDIYHDREYVEGMIPVAFNDVLILYGNESIAVEKRIKEKTHEIREKMLDAIAPLPKAAVAEEKLSKVDYYNPKKKTYLN